jgi:CRP-like cAMP-binding protein
MLNALTNVRFLEAKRTVTNRCLPDGTARSINANELHDAMEHRPELRRLLSRYALAFHQQVAHTAFCNAKSSIRGRVARWVLMVHDRIAKDDISLTHETIAETIGVRRASVSVALEDLQKAGLINTGHGHIACA